MNSNHVNKDILMSVSKTVLQQSVSFWTLYRHDQPPASPVFSLYNCTSIILHNMRYIVLYLLQLETKAFSLLKRPRSAFTFKNLLKHYAKQAPNHSK